MHHIQRGIEFLIHELDAAFELLRHFDALDRFSGRLAYSVRDDYVAFLGNNDQNIAGDNFAQKSGYLDASFSYKLPMDTNLSISLELQNITNEQQLTLFRNDDYMPRTAFAPGRQVLLGLFGSF